MGGGQGVADRTDQHKAVCVYVYFFFRVFLPCTMMICQPHCVFTGSRSQSPSLQVSAAAQKS